MRRLTPSLLICLLALVATSPSTAEDVSALGVFEKLKALEGSWRGGVAGESAEGGSMGDVVHEFRVSAAGTVVMETMAPGTAHEMINVYHIDGSELILTHYCAAGNQPTMRLDRNESTLEKLLFVFTGGTNLDVAVDEHIHSAEIELVDANHVLSSWKGRAGGREAGAMVFQLARSE